PSSHFLLVFMAVAKEMELDRHLLISADQAIEDSRCRRGEDALGKALDDLLLELLLGCTDEDGDAGPSIGGLVRAEDRFDPCLAGAANCGCGKACRLGR